MTSKNTPDAGPQYLRHGDAELLLHELQTRLREGRRLFAEVGQILAEINSRGVRDLFGYNSLAVFYEHVARVSRAEAKKVTDRALALNSRRSPDGQPTPAVAPLTGAAASTGVLADAGVDRIVTVMRRLPSHVTTNARMEAERDLVDLASVARPREVTAAGTDILARLDPDGVGTANPKSSVPRSEFWLRQKRTGRWDMRGNLDSETGARLNALMVPLVHPAGGEADRRTPAQKRGDAFAEVVEAATNNLDMRSIPQPRRESDQTVDHVQEEESPQNPSPTRNAPTPRSQPSAATQTRLQDHSLHRRSVARARVDSTADSSRTAPHTRPPRWWSRLSRSRSSAEDHSNGKPSTTTLKQPGTTTDGNGHRMS